MEDETLSLAVFIDNIKMLLSRLKDTDVSELSITNAQWSIEIKREISLSEEKTVDSTQSRQPGDDGKNEHLHTITSTLVGVFSFHGTKGYSEQSILNSGDRIRKGQILGFINSMNILNPIESNIDGRIVQVQVEDGEAVEFGQVLFLVEEDGVVQ